MYCVFSVLSMANNQEYLNQTFMVLYTWHHVNHQADCADGISWQNPAYFCDNPNYSCSVNSILRMLMPVFLHQNYLQVSEVNLQNFGPRFHVFIRD